MIVGLFNNKFVVSPVLKHVLIATAKVGSAATSPNDVRKKSAFGSNLKKTSCNHPEKRALSMRYHEYIHYVKPRGFASEKKSNTSLYDVNEKSVGLKTIKYMKPRGFASIKRGKNLLDVKRDTTVENSEKARPDQQMKPRSFASGRKPNSLFEIDPDPLGEKCERVDKPDNRSLWEKIVDYFRARPNCPGPDEWKKRALREKAERAAAAAGLAVCDKETARRAKCEDYKSKVITDKDL